MTQPTGFSRWLFAYFLAVGCSTPTESCVEPRHLIGVWQYSGTQDAPSSASVSGTLAITRQRCRDFEGLLDVVEVRAGQSQRTAGPVSGVLADSVVARFDVTLGTLAREHIARFTGDSVSGSWVEMAAGSVATGRFHGHLQAAQ